MSYGWSHTNQSSSGELAKLREAALKEQNAENLRSMGPVVTESSPEVGEAVVPAVEDLSEKELDSLSTEEIRRRALAEEQEKVRQIREADEPTDFVVRREITNKNGSKEIWEGHGASEKEAYDDFIEKITAGKSASNAHIERLENEAAVRKQQAQEHEDNEYVKKQRLKQLEKDPLRTIDELVDARLNARDAAQRAEQEAIERAKAIQTQWVEEHKHDYVANEFNGNLMIAAIQATGATEVTRENIDAAFAKLSREGRLQKPGSDTAPARTTQKSSSFRSGATPAPPAELSEEDMYKLPMEELRRRGDAALKAERERDDEWSR